MSEVLKEEQESKFSEVLKYQIKSGDGKPDFYSYREPFYWFIKHFSDKSMDEIAEHLHISSSTLTRKTKPYADVTDSRPLDKKTIDDICEYINVPLSSILFMYERKDFVEKLSKYQFDLLLSFCRGESDQLPNPSDKPSKKEKHTHEVKTVPVSSEKLSQISNHIDGKWYFYLPGTDAKTIAERRKLTEKESYPAHATKEEKELYDLYSSDHIYAGIIRITQSEQQYSISLKYLSNPKSAKFHSYSGSFHPSPNGQALFASLYDEKKTDCIYMILDLQSVEDDCQFLMSSVLLMSWNTVKGRQRPCSTRMILCREPVSPGTKAYTVMASNLMMNDKIIRIDEKGFDEIKRHQAQYNSPALNLFLEKYNSPAEIKAKESNHFQVNSCVFFSESILQNFLGDGITPRDALYLEAIFRLHSIAPWYSKSKSEKTNDLLKEFKENE